jgi:hypothetical protein
LAAIHRWCDHQRSPQLITSTDDPRGFAYCDLAGWVACDEYHGCTCRPYDQGTPCRAWRRGACAVAQRVRKAHRGRNREVGQSNQVLRINAVCPETIEPPVIAATLAKEPDAMNDIMRDQPIGRICAARSEILPACRETHATPSPLTDGGRPRGSGLNSRSPFLHDDQCQPT